MLILIVKGSETFNQETQKFVDAGEAEVFELEHSLVSVSKWESKFKKSFLSSKDKTTEETLVYIEAMIINPKNPRVDFSKFTSENFRDINEYIESSESATTFGEMPKTKSRNEIITSELIYYWMILFNIPFECQYWHLNRLLTLIRVCNLKNAKPKKMSKHETALKYRELNERRRAEYNTNG